MSARVLLVEDDADLRSAMTAALVADGHRVESCPDGQSALDALSTGGHEVVLLDIALGPGLDGVEICRRMRVGGDEAYVMMLTARDSESEIVVALESGADDYVVKPIGIVELRSRVRAALRRLRRGTSAGDTPDGAGGLLRQGELTVNPGAQSAAVGDRPLALTRSELAVLESLLHADGAVRSRTQLTEAIYGDNLYRDPRNVDVHVHNIREKLGAAGGDGAWLITVRGAGYRLGR